MKEDIWGYTLGSRSSQNNLLNHLETASEVTRHNLSESGHIHLSRGLNLRCPTYQSHFQLHIAWLNHRLTLPWTINDFRTTIGRFLLLYDCKVMEVNFEIMVSYSPYGLEKSCAMSHPSALKIEDSSQEGENDGGPSPFILHSSEDLGLVTSPIKSRPNPAPDPQLVIIVLFHGLFEISPDINPMLKILDSFSIGNSLLTGSSGFARIAVFQDLTVGSLRFLNLKQEDIRAYIAVKFQPHKSSLTPGTAATIRIQNSGQFRKSLLFEPKIHPIFLKAFGDFKCIIMGLKPMKKSHERNSP
jgi:hypothetical protein